MTVKLRRVKCEQCGASWCPRVEKPIKCVICQSRKWNKKK